MTVEFVELRRV